MRQGPRIYNLFPLPTGPLPRWGPHLARAARKGFSWIFVNPFQQAGYPGSLYSVKDHYACDAAYRTKAAHRALNEEGPITPVALGGEPRFGFLLTPAGAPSSSGERPPRQGRKRP